MLPKFIKKYFSWLQKDNPTGVPEKYPQQDRLGQTSVHNVFIVGDLTGIPLLKFAVENSRRKFLRIIRQKSFKHDQSIIQNNFENKNLLYDIVIIGAGPAGISVAREAQKKGLKYIIIEASEQPFETIRNFPKGKPMIYEPIDIKEESEIKLEGEKKEQLLEFLEKKVTDFNLYIQTGKKVEKIEIENVKGGASVQKIILSNGKELFGVRTFLAIGKSGNARKLQVEGENLPKVFNKLYDASEFSNKKILIVGGGDSALETAILLAQNNEVSISYRQESLLRAKAENINTIHTLEKQKKITLLLGTNVQKITEKTVIFAESNPNKKNKEMQNDIVFTLLGREMPYKFFEKCGISIENTWSKITKWWLLFSLSFANTLYFGKASNALPSNFSVFDLEFTQIVAWVSFIILLLSSAIVSFDIIKNFKKYFQTKWHFFKWGYITFAIFLFLWAFIGNKYFGENLLLFPDFEYFGMKGFGGDPYFWYGFLYTTSIAFFGLRRIYTSQTQYITKQTITLFLIQALPLFFIPNFVLPILNNFELIPDIIREVVFLGDEWWRFVGFILAWPLFIWNIFTEEPSMFWLIVSLIQTFIIIPWIVIKFGKGGYCSWICSCGAMAETVGDEYRNLAPHGKFWKKMELSGQWILFTIIIVTILHMLTWFSIPDYLVEISKNATLSYKLIVDTFLAGTLGVGLYFFFSGRVWCRFFCPLAAFMQIIQKWGQYRIFSDKKKCISCGICTKVCHMGIDVMSYAQQGKPMDDAECVRCSACVKECPMGVLSFGRYKEFFGSKKTKEE